jgi:Tol biopolymer transport system component
VPIGGGSPREIEDNVIAADWSPDGSQLAIVRAVPGGQVLEYPIGKKLFESAGSIAWPRISPDGNSIAFEDCPLSWDFSGQITVIGRDGSRRAIGPHFSGVLGLAWSPDGREIWFNGVDRGIISGLKAIDLQGHLRTLLPLPGAFLLMDLAADGRALMMRDGFTSNLLFRSAGSDHDVQLYWHDNSVIRDISADGSQILLSEGGAASVNDWSTYMRETTGAPAVFLGKGFGTAFSPDGHWAMLNPNDSAQLIALPTRAGNTQSLTSGTIRYVTGRWLPVGERIVAVGSAPGHRERYYLLEPGKGEPKPISNEDLDFDRGDEIVISPDGRTMAAAIAAKGIQLIDLNGGPPRGLQSTTGLVPATWCQDNSLLVYRRGQIPAHITRLNLSTGEQRPWKDLAPADRTALTSVGCIRISRDCETYAYTSQYDPSDLWMVSGVR